MPSCGGLKPTLQDKFSVRNQYTALLNASRD
jgi:hypothetical protein